MTAFSADAIGEGCKRCLDLYYSSLSPASFEPAFIKPAFIGPALIGPAFFEPAFIGKDLPVTNPADLTPLPHSSGADQTTLAAYNRDAASFANDWSAQPAPSDMYDILRRFFAPGPTADIGCGAGRDTAWLAANGFPAIGYDASEGLLAEAKRRHPAMRFQHASLPALQGVADSSFRNVLCETVIMHLQPSAITEAVSRLVSILMPGGVLFLSWRLAPGNATRDAHGRLYAAFEPHLVLAALGEAEILLDDQPVSASSGKPIRRVVARKQNSHGRLQVSPP
jgi:SAM-dependent methyltransferase